MVRIKEKFLALFKEDEIGKIYSQIGQIKRELKLFYTKEMRYRAESILKFVQEEFKESFSLQETS